MTSISNTVTTFSSLLGVTHQISSITGLQLRGKNDSALNHTADVLKAMSASGKQIQCTINISMLHPRA